MSIRSSPIRRSRMIFVVSDKILGAGEADKDACNGLVLEEVAGTRTRGGVRKTIALETLGRKRRDTHGT
jgi:hypothetical protein